MPTNFSISQDRYRICHSHYKPQNAPLVSSFCFGTTSRKQQQQRTNNSTPLLDQLTHSTLSHCWTVITSAHTIIIILGYHSIQWHQSSLPVLASQRTGMLFITFIQPLTFRIPRRTIVISNPFDFQHVSSANQLDASSHYTTQPTDSNATLTNVAPIQRLAETQPSAMPRSMSRSMLGNTFQSAGILTHGQPLQGQVV